MTAGRAILIALDRCATGSVHLLVPELTLLGDVQGILPGGITVTALRRELTVLEMRSEVVSDESHPDRGRQWKITAQGRARLAE